MKLRLRSPKVVQDSSVAGEAEVDERSSQSCWANMPSELLREVLIRIEESEDKWPSRKNVVACAGVCRGWREIMKEVVKTPQVSGRITFPISVKQVWILTCFFLFLFFFFLFTVYWLMGFSSFLVLMAHTFQVIVCV